MATIHFGVCTQVVHNDYPACADLHHENGRNSRKERDRRRGDSVGDGEGKSRLLENLECATIRRFQYL